jgi:gas vesicle protein
MYGNNHNHHMSHESGGHDFLSGMLVGAAVGAAVGLLFAPRAGADMRERMAESAQRLRRTAGQTYDQATSKVNDVMDRGKGAWERGRETFETARAEYAGDGAEPTGQA